MHLDRPPALSLLSAAVAASDPYYQSPDLVIAHRDRVCIALCRGEITADLIKRAQDGVLALAKGNSSGVAYLFVLAEGAGIPASLRDAIGKMFDAIRPHLRVISGHIAGSGFRASAMRSLFTFATSRILKGTPVKAHGDLVEATLWLEARCKEATLGCPPSKDLHALVTRLGAPT